MNEECKVVFHFIRHAEAYHNVAAIVNRWHITDPPLTPKGIRQCEKLKEALPQNLKINLILCSPMMRTMQTALHVFDNALRDESIRLIAVPDLREWGGGHAATGSSYEDIKSNPALSRVDLGMVTRDWHVNRERYGDKSRAKVVREDLFEMAKQVQKGGHSVWPNWGRLSTPFEWPSPDSIQGPFHIVVVSHANFLENLLDIACGNGFFNGNMRNYGIHTISDENGKESHYFQQTMESLNDPMNRSPIPVDTSDILDPNLRVVTKMPDIITLHSRLKRQLTEARAGTLDALFADVKMFLTKARAGEQSLEALKAQMWRFEMKVDALHREDERKIQQTEQNYWMGVKGRHATMYEYIGPEAVEFKRAMHPWLAEVAGDEDVKDYWERKMKKVEEEDDDLMEGDGEHGSESEETAIHGLGISMRDKVEVDTPLKELNRDKIGGAVEDKDSKRKASEDYEKMDVVEGCIVDNKVGGDVDIWEEYAKLE